MNFSLKRGEMALNIVFEYYILNVGEHENTKGYCL